MNDKLAAAHDFREFLIRVEPRILDPTDIREKLRWFILAICDPATSQHRAFAQDRPITITQDILKAALDVKPQRFRERLPLLENGSFGPVRKNSNHSVEIVPPTEDDMRQFMEIRILLDTEAALKVHRAENSPDLKCYLGPELKTTLSDIRRLTHKIQSAGANYDGMDVQHRIDFEELCQAKSRLHNLIFEATKMTKAAELVAVLRFRKRMWYSHRQVTVTRLLEDEQEHIEIMDAMLPPSDGNVSEMQLREAVANHLRGTLHALLTTPPLN